MIIYIILYLFVGVLWAIFCEWMTKKLNYPIVHWYEHIIAFFINTVLWCVSMPIGIYRMIM